MFILLVRQYEHEHNENIVQQKFPSQIPSSVVELSVLFSSLYWRGLYSGPACCAMSCSAWRGNASLHVSSLSVLFPQSGPSASLRVAATYVIQVRNHGSILTIINPSQVQNSFITVNISLTMP